MMPWYHPEIMTWSDEEAHGYVRCVVPAME
jgi:hypothetical protein